MTNATVLGPAEVPQLRYASVMSSPTPAARGFFDQARVIVVAGKGGVGKTTIAAALGLLSSACGHPTELVDVEDRNDLGRCFGLTEIGFQPTVVQAASKNNESLAVRSLAAEDAAVEYLTDQGMGRVLKLLRGAGTLLDTLTSLTPGLRSVLQLAKVRSISDDDPNKVVIVDAPAAGHAVSFLRSPLGLLASIDSGPLHHQSKSVVDMFGDHARSQVLLVTLPEYTPVQETIETAYTLEEDLGLKLSPVVVNKTLPVWDGLDRTLSAAATKSSQAAALAEAARLRDMRQREQQDQIQLMTTDLPLPTIALPELLVQEMTAGPLQELADLLGAGFGEPR